MQCYTVRSIVTVALAVIVVLLAVAPDASPAREKPILAGSALDEEGGPSEKRVYVTVDPRIELLAVVQHFTSWASGGHIKSKTTYKSDIDDYFGDFKRHRAIACVESLIRAGFTHDAPVRFILHHGDPPELVQESPYSDYLVRRARGKEPLRELADALRDFARKTDFMKFYRAHSTLYSSHVAAVESLLADKNYVHAIEHFFGKSAASYRVILAPLFAGGYGPGIATQDGLDLYAVLGPCGLRGERTTFACLGYLESIILHEWSHSFVNPLVDQYYDRFDKSAHLFEPIKGMMRRQAYPSWRIALYEHIVRACEIHIRASLNEKFNTDRAIRNQEAKGFWYIGYIDSLLTAYQTHRGRYPTFDQFVPVIAMRLSEVSVEDLPESVTTFAGPLNSIFPRTDRIYLIYPTATEDELMGKIREDIEAFATFFSSATPVKFSTVSDREALGIDWQDKVGFVYGNTTNNLFLRSLKIPLPVRFGDDVIELGTERYEGGEILLISCMPNPFNRSLPFALCANGTWIM